MISRTKQNYIFQVLYGILSMIIPLVTAPYITRVLGASNLGIYNYTYSIAGVFLKVAELGVINHGSRSIAEYQNDIDLRSKVFWEIYVVQLTSSVLLTSLYLIYVFVFVKENYMIALLQVIYVSSSLFNVRWFYMGLENFKTTVTRDLIVKVISFVSLYVFVRDRTDLWKYTVLTLCTFTISNIFLWLGIRKNIKWVKPTAKGVLTQIKPMLILFIPTIAVTIYTVMDKVMLGAMSGEISVAYYHYASVIVAIPLFFITSFGQVMLPKLTAMAATGDKNSDTIVAKSLSFAFFMACAFSFGLSAISSDLIPFYYGEEFNSCILLLILISFKLPFMAYSDVLRSQILIPQHEDFKFIISLFCGAVTNLMINLLLIPKYGPAGAAVGTIASEAIVSFCQVIFSKKYLDVIKCIKTCLPFVVIGFVMYILVVEVKNNLYCEILLKIIIEIVVGALCYLALSLLYVHHFVDRKIIHVIFSKLN